MRACVTVCVCGRAKAKESECERVCVCVCIVQGSKGGEYFVNARLANTLGNANQVYFVILSVFAH